MSRRLILIALLVCLGAWLRLANLNNVTTRTPDERVYTYQARMWMQSGEAGIRSLVSEYKSDAETRLYPPPTRVGMIRLIADLIRWTGHDDESTGARISCAASIGSLLVFALIAVRFLPSGAALASLLFYAVLPAEIAVSRRTWTDALVELAILLLVWFTCEITRDSQRRFLYPAFALASGLGLTVKESLPVPCALCALWILWTLMKRSEWKNMLFLVSATLAAVAISLWWLAGQVGSLSDYVGIVLGIPAANAGNPYALEYASGPPWLMLRAFWIVAPFTSLFSLAGLLAVSRKRGPVWIWLTFFTVAYVAIAMAIPHWINLRYVGGAFGPFCMLAGLGCWYLISTVADWLDTADRRPFAIVAIAIVMGGAVADYLRFQRFFVRDDIADLSIKMLIDEQNQ